MPIARLLLPSLITISISLVVAQSTLAQQPTHPEDKKAPVIVPVKPAADDDFMRRIQFEAVEFGDCEWCHWGDRPDKFSNWTTHSNRLVPVYTWGAPLDDFEGTNSCYRDKAKLKSIYGRVPEKTLNPDAEYFDQTDIYRLQQQAIEAGKKHVIMIVFDGMDWQTTQAAAIYEQKKVVYKKGRGAGLGFLDYQNEYADYGFCVTSPHNNDTKVDMDGQAVTVQGKRGGGYNVDLGGTKPWSRPADPRYLLGQRKSLPHGYTDSAASATSLFSGIKTYNSAINVAPDGSQVEPIARELQGKGYAIGVVTSVPISHATPASTYANNVTRNDYQDIARDMLGLRSVAHRDKALPGVDVLIGCGKTDFKADDRKKQGKNYVPGNKYLTDKELKKINVESGGRYRVAVRTKDVVGRTRLLAAASEAATNDERLFGFYGKGGHLPYRTADGNYDPTRGANSAERYTPADLIENPTLADMAEAALMVLEKKDRFWLMIEAGEVDWANHNNNIDDSIGAVVSGDRAFQKVVQWVESNSNWDETALILTADHGHLLFVDDLEVLTGKPPCECVKPAVKAKTVANKE